MPESLEKIGDGAFSETAYDKNKDVNPNEIVSDGTYRYQLTKDETGYILHGPVVNEGIASVNGEIKLPATYDGKSVVELKDNAFDGIGGITSVTIPGTYKKIGAYAFCDSTALETVVVEDGVEEIGMYAFSDCSNLVNVTFPDTIVSEINPRIYSPLSLMAYESTEPTGMSLTGTISKLLSVIKILLLDPSSTSIISLYSPYSLP